MMMMIMTKTMIVMTITMCNAIENDDNGDSDECPGMTVMVILVLQLEHCA